MSTTVRVETVGGPVGSHGSSGRKGWKAGGRYLRFDGAGDRDPEIPDVVPLRGGRYVYDGARFVWAEG